MTAKLTFLMSAWCHNYVYQPTDLILTPLVCKMFLWCHADTENVSFTAVKADMITGSLSLPRKSGTREQDMLLGNTCGRLKWVGTIICIGARWMCGSCTTKRSNMFIQAACFMPTVTRKSDKDKKIQALLVLSELRALEMPKLCVPSLSQRVEHEQSADK